MRGFNKEYLTGFTLIELVLVIVIVSVAATSIALMYSTNVGRSHEPLLRQLGVSMATAYMDEILRKKWCECSPRGGGRVNTASNLCPDGTTPIPPLGPDGVESRREYDDVDDYHGLNQTPTGATGTTLSGYDGFNVSVTVVHPSADWNGISAEDVKKITVTVEVLDGQSIVLTAYRANF